MITRTARISVALCVAAGTVPAAALVSIAALGPMRLAMPSTGWIAAFLATWLALAAWWAGYVWLYHRINPTQAREYSWLLLPLGLLALALVPDLVVLLAGKLPYTLAFDDDGYRFSRYTVALIIVVSAIAQEIVLLRALKAGGRGVASSKALPSAQGPALLTPVGRSAIPPILLVLAILAGLKLRLDALDVYHGGDMDVMLSLTYNLLGWPVVAYYHNYASQSWVYNHLPFFPMTLAPFYWLFENVLRLPTPWAAKMLTGAADVVIAIILYRQAGGGGWRRWLGLALAALWMLSPWVVVGDDHPIPFSIAFTLLALVSLDRPWLCGLMLGLGVASRNEVAFLSLPLLVHFAFRRPLSESIPFFATSGTALALIVLPFVLFDPAAMDYALRGQLQRDASSVQSMLFLALQPVLPRQATEFLRFNPSLPALACTGAAALLSLREQRVERVMLLVALIYLVTLPLIYDRYLLFSFALALYYASRFSQPLFVVPALLIVWPGFPYFTQVTLALLLLLAIVVLVRPVGHRQDGEANSSASLEPVK